MNWRLSTFINHLEKGANIILMQWIVDTRMEEVTPMGEGELNAKENKEMICLHEKYPILTLLQPFLSTLILSFIF